MQNYLVYTDDGVRVELPFGLFREEEPLPDPGEVSVVERPGPEEQEEPGSPRRPSPPPAPCGRRSCPWRSGEGHRPGGLEALGADALVVELKDGSGRLAWQSEQALAGLTGGNGDEAVNRALAELEAAGVPVSPG